MNILEKYKEIITAKNELQEALRKLTDGTDISITQQTHYTTPTLTIRCGGRGGRGALIQVFTGNDGIEAKVIDIVNDEAKYALKQVNSILYSEFKQD